MFRNLIKKLEKHNWSSEEKQTYIDTKMIDDMGGKKYQIFLSWR